MGVGKSTLKFYTLSEIVKKNSSKPNKKSKNCRVYKVKYRASTTQHMIFLVKCGEEYSDKKGHIVYVNMQKIKVNKLTRPVLAMPMKYKCSCPAFLYWGSWYNATEGKYLKRGETKERRPPVVRDPKNENLVCKHISALLPALKANTVKRAMKGNYNKKFSLLEKDPQEMEYALWSEVLDTMEVLGFNPEEVTSNNLEDLVSSYFES